MAAKNNINPYLLAAAAGAGLFIFYKLFKKQAPEVSTGQTVNTELTQAILKTPLSYPPGQYKIGADNLKNAMFDVGTDENSIFRIFNLLKNNADFLALVSAFGIRPKYEFGINVGSWNLGQWLQDELSSGELLKINQILVSKGITYTI
jgi:hypothetical protein